MKMRRSYVILFSTLIFLLIIFCAIQSAVNRATPVVERYIQKMVAAQCATCEFSLEAAHLTWSGFTLQTVHFAGGEAGMQRLKVEVPSATVGPRWLALLRGKMEIAGLLLEQP